MESTTEEAATAAAPILEGEEGCTPVSTSAGSGCNLNGDNSGLVDLPPSGVVEKLGDLKLRF